MFIKLIRCINCWFVVWYYPKSVDTCQKPIFTIICFYFSKKQTRDVIVLAKGLIEDSGEAIIN